MSSPPLKPPDGDSTRGPTLVGVATALTTLAIVCLAARLYTRLRIMNKLGIDDLILALNMCVLIIPELICIGMMVKYGLGRHIAYLSEHQLFTLIKWIYISEPFGTMMTCIPKIAVVVFLHKVLDKVHRPSIYVLYALIAALGVISITLSFLTFFQCRPAYGPWTPGVETVCWNPHPVINFSYFVGATNAFLDLVLALYPLTFVPQLQIKLKQKIALCCVMGLGVFACGCAVARTTQLGVISTSKDFTWEGPNLYHWAAAEANTITICASIPAIVPLILYKRRFRDSRTERSKSHHGVLQASSSRNPLAHDQQTSHGSSDVVATVGRGEIEERTSDEGIIAITEVSMKRRHP